MVSVRELARYRMRYTEDLLNELMKTKPLPQNSDNLTPQQRFFVGWAQMWCENRSDEVARLHAKINPHSPGRYRTNGVVSNMPEFATAFSCQADAPMVRAEVLLALGQPALAHSE